MADVFRTFIIPTAKVQLARDIAASFGPGGEGMWTTGLASTSDGIPTHFISTGYVPDQFAFMVPCNIFTWDPDDEIWIKTVKDAGDSVAVYNHCVNVGIDTTQANIDELFSAADVTEQEPFVAVQRLGLVIVQPTEV